MKLVHNMEMRVFVKETDNEDKIVLKVKELFPFDFDKEKIEFKSKTTYGFEEHKIKILTVFIKKQHQTTKVIKQLMNKLKKKSKTILLDQLKSRLDDKLNFYIRLNKEKLLLNEYELTESGDCFWFKLCIAAYPHKREIAENIVRQILEM